MPIPPDYMEIAATRAVQPELKKTGEKFKTATTVKELLKKANNGTNIATPRQ